MRNAVGIFGAACAVVVIGLVARYGHKTTDIEFDAWIMAFLFGVIAAAGLGGHAVAARLWQFNKPVSVAMGIVCAAALMLNISNSLGAIAGRQDHATMERVARNRDIRAAEAEIQRLGNLRNEMPAFVQTDADAVAAAKRAADAATIAKERECAGGDPKQRGHLCRNKEAAESIAMTAWRDASAAKAASDRAGTLETETKAQREKLAALGPVATVNLQGSAIAKLFRLPDSEAEFAAMAQQFGIAVIVELIIVLCLVAWELLGRASSSRSTAINESLAIAPIAPVAHMPVEPKATFQKLQPSSRPKIAPPSTPTGSVAEILAGALEPGAKNERVDLEECHTAYVASCAAMSKPAVELEKFVGLVKHFCAACQIETEVARGKIYLIGVRLTREADNRFASRPSA